MTKRGWFACAISLALHGLLVLGVFQLCAYFQSSPVSPKPVNRLIEPPVDYGSVWISFAEETSLPEPIRNPRKIEPPIPPKKRDELPPAAAVRAQGDPIETQPNQGTAASGLAQAGHREPGVAPLHGKIARPGTSIVYVLDQSASMARERKLQRAIAMLKASLRQLGPDVRFQIVGYDSKPATFRIGGSFDLAPASESNLLHAEALLDGVIGEGSSRHAEGLIAGLGLRPDLLILLTDADELSPQEVKHVKGLNRKGTTIHAVLFGTTSTRTSSLEEVVGRDRLHHVR